MNNRSIGTQKEQIAAEYLNKYGFRIIETNYHFHKMGEIDIIGLDKEYLVFVEVKYRKTASAGYAAEAVNYRKIHQICKVADAYLMTHKFYSNKSIRFDVIAIDGENINWIKNAFDYAL